MTDGRPALPAGLRLRLDPEVRRVDRRTLIGGSPLRILRVTERGGQVIDGWSDGGSVPSGAGEQALARRLLDAGVAHPDASGVGGVDLGRVAAVIPVRGEPVGLDGTLAAVGRSGVRTVVVVDDGSSPADAREIASIAAAHGARLVRNPTSLGAGGARQRGVSSLAADEFDLLAFVDSDVVPDADWLADLLGHLADPEVAAVAPRIVAAPPASLPAPLAAYERVRSSLDRGPRPGPVRPRSRVPYVPTAAIVVRRQALDRVGGFDEALRYGEDVDLVWRLVAAGWGVRYQPEVTATHPARPSTGEWLRQRYHYGTSAVPLAERHGGAVAPLTVSGWSAAAWALVGLGSPLAGAGLMAGTTVALARKLRGLPRPLAEAARLAGLGNLHAGRQVASALRRAWFPALLPMLAWRRTRPAAVAALVVPPLLDRREAQANRPGPLAWIAISLADDVAYGAGLWSAALRARRFQALAPAFAGRFPPPDQAKQECP